MTLTTQEGAARLWGPARLSPSGFMGLGRFAPKARKIPEAGCLTTASSSWSLLPGQAPVPFVKHLPLSLLVSTPLTLA